MNNARTFLLIAVLGLVGLTLVGAASSRACSFAASLLDGVIGGAGEVAFLQTTGDEERPGTYRWLLYSAGGTLLSEREIAVPWADVSIDPLVLAASGSLWLRISCHRSQQPLHCGTLQEVLADGTFGRRIPLPPGRMNLWVEGEQVRYGVVDGNVLEVREIDLEDGATRRLWRLEMAERLWGRASQWTLGSNDEIVLAIACGEGDVGLVRLDARGNEVARACFPRARSGLDPIGDDGVRRLGPFGRMSIAADGVVAVEQSANDPDCRQYQPPSVALFAPDLSRLGVAENKSRIRSLRRVGSSLMVLGHYGVVKRFSLDGALIDAWAPDLPSMGTLESQWEGTWEEIPAAAAALQRDSPLADRIKLFEDFEDDKLAEVDSWWVEEGPETYDALPDFYWQRLASRLCARHPVQAPEEALRRYDRSRGAHQEEWFGAIVACFEDPVPRVYEHAVATASDDPSHADHKVVFEAWGDSREISEELW